MQIFSVNSNAPRVGKNIIVELGSIGKGLEAEIVSRELFYSENKHSIVICFLVKRRRIRKKNIMDIPSRPEQCIQNIIIL